MSSTAAAVTKALKDIGTPEKAASSARFFKTGKGQYGYGDVFFGVTVPEQRMVAKNYAALPLVEIGKLLRSKVHECRLTGLLILVRRFVRAEAPERERIAAFYLRHKRRINNWDLVDLSAPSILGMHLLGKDRSILYELARSKNLWDRRIAIIATFAFIRHGDHDDTLAIAESLLDDEHNLIHKAVGWMLREVGNRSPAVEEAFLEEHVAKMPRTMLRYAIEKFPEAKRGAWLKK
jgi:3-methyladenine DNA glycosylase AlkD